MTPSSIQETGAQARLTATRTSKAVRQLAPSGRAAVVVTPNLPFGSPPLIVRLTTPWSSDPRDASAGTALYIDNLWMRRIDTRRGLGATGKSRT